MAELIRKILVHTEAKWENEFISIEDWRSGLKEQTKSKHLPLLEVDSSCGKKILQESDAIISLLGAASGLMPTEMCPMYRVRVFMGIYRDIVMQGKSFFCQTDQEKKLD
uniref:Glutathione S-transferase class-mu 28 kDa isozyme n=1 Tax=Lepeophtheirus salmonis TaxID=72036 RepID=D3PIR5_LEPSM|nr:Glutathione S-transferase class-mu 28 kDa isozyme [Lepeophtheirus salmonis]